ncbi:Ribonuclease BN [hydrothermal vent metagenome]|uniref:Ribonuclease BN n=1 Tax=hydrothermal vent metagenome TaxID=652676 RepID=A0A1W1D558_9ZZZZ
MSNKQNIKHIFRHIKFFITSFIDKELTLFAASLSFYTIFTIIPLLLIMMSLITALPSFSDIYLKLQEYILSNLMPIKSQMVMLQINGFLENSSKLGVIGTVSVIIASLLFFQNFEYIANRIFKAKKRSLWDGITTYWTLITLTPIAMGTSFYLTAKIASMLAHNEYTSNIDFLPIIPYFITWGLFFVIFQVAANTKINPKASAISSLLTSIVFNIAKGLFVFYVIVNKSYTTMYGSFAILVFLFLWIYISWIIFIYGLKLCHILNEAFKVRDSH